MGYFRFFRRKKIGPGLSLNLSKSGPSLSIGPRGSKVTIGRRGTRQTVGLPGTGLYYTSTSRHGRTRSSTDSSGAGYLVLAVIALALIVTFWQYVVLIAIGLVGLGLIWWTLRRDRAVAVRPVDPAAMLIELDDLHRAGVLTDAEYEQKSAEVRGVVSEPTTRS